MPAFVTILIEDVACTFDGRAWSHDAGADHVPANWIVRRLNEHADPLHHDSLFEAAARSVMDAGMEGTVIASANAHLRNGADTLPE